MVGIKYRIIHWFIAAGETVDDKESKCLVVLSFTCWHVWGQNGGEEWKACSARIAHIWKCLWSIQISSIYENILYDQILHLGLLAPSGAPKTADICFLWLSHVYTMNIPFNKRITVLSNFRQLKYETTISTRSSVAKFWLDLEAQPGPFYVQFLPKGVLSNAVLLNKTLVLPLYGYWLVMFKIKVISRLLCYI